MTGFFISPIHSTLAIFILSTQPLISALVMFLQRKNRASVQLA
nr:MAG TPA: hypothetical protein [Caudoviricetes sp.]